MHKNIGNLDVIGGEGAIELRLHNQVPGVRSSILSRSEATQLIQMLSHWLSTLVAPADEDLIG